MYYSFRYYENDLILENPHILNLKIIKIVYRNSDRIFLFYEFETFRILTNKFFDDILFLVNIVII
ncbi:hypothetical protein RhiirC2_747278 [Rhizophagus irregularis]|uniref:Uncharacterized protein n=1 Tax=Rhizophagus irregularis TaxID=588596 RepID=A0A2N1N7Z3_9GLOM|nr:hypothetical protein RhiirC2_747278 [Rhizophagus irregularis]